MKTLICVLLPYLEPSNHLMHVIAKSSPSSRSPNPSNEIQFMITHSMRLKLQDDLGYLPEEVDDMEPQIAAVVIEKELARPSKGMPSSWRKKTNIILRTSFGKKISQILADSKVVVDRSVSVIQQSIGVSLPYILPIVSGIILTQGGYMLFVKIMDTSINSDNRRSRKTSSSSRLSSTKSNIDLNSFQSVSNTGLWDSIKLNWNLWTKKYE